MYKKLLIILFSHIVYCSSISNLHLAPPQHLDKADIILETLDYVSETLKLIAISPLSENELIFSYGFDAFNKFLIGCKECLKFTKAGWVVGSKNFLHSVKDIIEVSLGEATNFSESEKWEQFIWLSLNKIMPISLYSRGHLYWLAGNFIKSPDEDIGSQSYKNFTATSMYYIGIDFPF